MRVVSAIIPIDANTPDEVIKAFAIEAERLFGPHSEQICVSDVVSAKNSIYMNGELIQTE